MSQLQPAPEQTTDTALHTGRLGIFGIVFFVVAAAAPLVGMTGAVPVAIVVGNGAAAPGAYVVAGIVLLLFSVGYAAMATKVTNVGAFFAFVGRGLGSSRVSGRASSRSSPTWPCSWPCTGSSAGRDGADGRQGRHPLPWWAWTLIAWVLVTALSALSVDVGAKVLGVLMRLELASLVIVAFAVLVEEGRRGSTSGHRSLPSKSSRPDSPVRPASRWPSRSRRTSASRRPRSTARNPRTRRSPCLAPPTWP